MVVRKALLRSVELGRMHASTSAVLIRLVGGSNRLKTENKVDHASARAAVRANPNVTLGRLKQKFGISKDTAARIKRDVLRSEAIVRDLDRYENSPSDNYEIIGRLPAILRSSK